MRINPGRTVTLNGTASVRAPVFVDPRYRETIAGKAWQPL